MDHLLAGTDIRLTYLQDRRALAAIDWPGVFDDLVESGAQPNRCLWSNLDRLTHVILATGRATGQCAGMLGLMGGTAGGDTYLMVDAVMTLPGEIGARLVLAMLAHALARVVSLDGKPAALAATQNDAAIRLGVAVLSGHLAAAVTYPPLTGNVVLLGTADLARRVGGCDLVMDLRQATELMLLRDLRRLHNVREERAKPRAVRKPARTASATRHPRKAIRTEKIG